MLLHSLFMKKLFKKFRWHIVTIILIFVILVPIGILIGFYISNKIADENRIIQGPDKYMHESWKMYTDPDENFSITIPSSWPIGSWAYSGGFYSYDDGSGGVNLGKPYHFIRTGKNVTISDFMIVYITVNKPVSKYCNGGKPNTNISGFPAFYDDSFDEWYINTNKADYFLSAGYNGGEECGFGCPLGFIEPSYSQDYIKANQAVINKVISSFKPLNQTPYVCK